jgi:hypothetical protein
MILGHEFGHTLHSPFTRSFVGQAKGGYFPYSGKNALGSLAYEQDASNTGMKLLQDAYKRGTGNVTRKDLLSQYDIASREDPYYMPAAMKEFGRILWSNSRLAARMLGSKARQTASNTIASGQTNAMPALVRVNKWLTLPHNYLKGVWDDAGKNGLGLGGIFQKHPIGLPLALTGAIGEGSLLGLAGYGGYNLGSQLFDSLISSEDRLRRRNQILMEDTNQGAFGAQDRGSAVQK